MLYIRMSLSILVSLYTSRVVLQTLGVNDYGVYGLVGGIVSMFSFLNASMSGATSRFLTFEMGRNDEKRLQETFSSTLIIHVGIALLVFFIAETIGLWFLCNKLVIPADRINAAICVYQCSILSMMFAVTQVPYNATIIAHEQMDVYAYVELLHVFLKLGIVYLLLLCNIDKLVLYAILVLLVSVIVAMTYRLYCVRHYKESHFQWVWDKSLLKPMLSFSGWNILGHFGFSFRTQGTNMVLNMFFGPIVNAAGGLASTVQSILYGFSGNVITALKPQIIKRYSMGHYHEMANLIYAGIKISLLLILIMSIPLLIKTSYILELWLNVVPDFCVSFCRILLLSNILSTISQIIYIGIQATGDLKQTSLVRNVVYVSTPFIIYFVFELWKETPSFAYYVILFSHGVISITDFLILTHKVKAVELSKILCILLTAFLAALFIFFMCQFLNCMIINEVLSTICVFIFSTLLLIIFFYFLVLNKEERLMAKKFLKNQNRI